MPYIYKYIDRKDGLVKYVGIIKKDTNFPKRFLQHKNDPWASNGKWMDFDIQYAYFASGTDVEALEAHLIWKHGTFNYYNKGKADWGRCSFAPDENDIKWIQYSLLGSAPKDRLDKMSHTIMGLEQQIQDLWHQYEILQEECRCERIREIHGYKNRWKESEEE